MYAGREEHGGRRAHGRRYRVCAEGPCRVRTRQTLVHRDRARRRPESTRLPVCQGGHWERLLGTLGLLGRLLDEAGGGFGEEEAEPVAKPKHDHRARGKRVKSDQRLLCRLRAAYPLAIGHQLIRALVQTCRAPEARAHVQAARCDEASCIVDALNVATELGAVRRAHGDIGSGPAHSKAFAAIDCTQRRRNEVLDRGEHALSAVAHARERSANLELGVRVNAKLRSRAAKQ